MLTCVQTIDVSIFLLVKKVPGIKYPLSCVHVMNGYPILNITYSLTNKKNCATIC